MEKLRVYKVHTDVGCDTKVTLVTASSQQKAEESVRDGKVVYIKDVTGTIRINIKNLKEDLSKEGYSSFAIDLISSVLSTVLGDVFR